MDLIQIINGCAALVAFGASVWTFLRFHDANSPTAHLAHILNGTILLWIAAVYLAAGFDVADTDPSSALRWSLAPLLATYTARQLLAGRRQTHGELR